MTAGPVFTHHGFCNICERRTEFTALYDWFRDHLLCASCGSVPRERALMETIKRYYPKFARLKIHESSPIGRGVSARLARDCRNYSFSHYLPDTPFGQVDPLYNARSETLEALTFADGSFDLLITQDVMEHVFNPDAAFREIARVLKPGGAHIFTVPITRKGDASRRRAQLEPDGTITHFLEPEYHGSPVSVRGSLVTMDWGYDIVRHIHEASGMSSHIIMMDDLDRGIRAELIDVVISFRR
ncbi:class I SAM-dependent methyltransferase [Hyphomonas sp.]|uniref:class I SAM-dependent methyltransferase n=1 Tax=Hyphomonas sp. TaxID=87 RepID=UPI00391DEF77